MLDFVLNEIKCSLIPLGRTKKYTIRTKPNKTTTVSNILVYKFPTSLKL